MCKPSKLEDDKSFLRTIFPSLEQQSKEKWENFKTFYDKQYVTEQTVINHCLLYTQVSNKLSCFWLNTMTDFSTFVVWAQSGSERIKRVMMHIHSREFWQWFEFTTTQLWTWMVQLWDLQYPGMQSVISRREIWIFKVHGPVVLCWHLLLCFYVDYNVQGSLSCPGTLWCGPGTRRWLFYQLNHSCPMSLMKQVDQHLCFPLRLQMAAFVKTMAPKLTHILDCVQNLM